MTRVCDRPMFLVKKKKKKHETRIIICSVKKKKTRKLRENFIFNIYPFLFGLLIAYRTSASRLFSLFVRVIIKQTDAYK